jgi:hypothetical protein
MKKTIRDKWVKALRGGKYRQGSSNLRTEDMYCCLGVLCDLHSQAAFMAWEYDEKSGIYRYMGESVVLPFEVCSWAGLKDPNPIAVKMAMTTHNDSGKKSFKRLAALIERYL